MTQDIFDSQTSGTIESFSFDFITWLNDRIPVDVLDLKNNSEDDVIATIAELFNRAYKKTKFIPFLNDVVHTPSLYLVFLGNLLGIENFDLLSARLSNTSGTTLGEPDFSDNDILAFRRFIKESIFRYHKKGTIEGTKKVLFYLQHLVDVEELWTRDWKRYFAKDKIVNEMLFTLGINPPILESALKASDFFKTETLVTSSFSTSGSTSTLSDITSGGELLSLIRTKGGFNYALVDVAGNNKLFLDANKGYYDTNISNVVDIKAFVHSDFGNPTDLSLQRGLLAVLRKTDFLIIKEDDPTFIENSFTDSNIKRFINVFDGSNNRYVYFETTNEVIRADGNIFSILAWINKTQYGKIRTVDADFVVPINTDNRLYFFTHPDHTNCNKTILVRGWNQTIPDSTSFSTSTPLVSGPATSGFTDGITTLYCPFGHGNYTSGSGTSFPEWFYQDVTSSCETSGVSAFNPNFALYYISQDELNDSDPGILTYRNPPTSGWVWNSSIFFDCSQSVETSASSGVSTMRAIPENIPDFRIKNVKYKYDVFKNIETGNIEITYQKSNKLYRSYLHQILGNDPNSKGSLELINNVTRYLSFEEDEKFVYRLYLTENGKTNLMIESKDRSSLESITLNIFEV